MVTTGDPLWPLPAATEADRFLVHWDGRTTELSRQDGRYSEVMAALNRALTSPAGIEYRYGISAADVSRLRASDLGALRAAAEATR